MEGWCLKEKLRWLIERCKDTDKDNTNTVTKTTWTHGARGKHWGSIISDLLYDGNQINCEVGYSNKCRLYREASLAVVGRTLPMATCPRSRHQLTSQLYRSRCGPCLDLGCGLVAYNGYLSKVKTWANLSIIQLKVWSLSGPWTKASCSWLLVQVPDMGWPLHFSTTSSSQNTKQLTHLALAIINHCQCQSLSIIVNHCQSL